MMQKIRDRATSTAAKILFFLIILSFGGWGASDYFNNPNNKNEIAGSVNKQEIPRQYLEQEFNRMMNDYAVQDQDLTQQQLDSIKMEAFNRIVNNIVLSQNAQKLGLQASFTEVSDNIKNNPVFQENNMFNREKYNQLLKSNNIVVSQYENNLSSELAIQHLIKAIEKSSFVAEKSLSEIVAMTNSQRDMQVATFEVNMQLLRKSQLRMRK